MSTIDPLAALFTALQTSPTLQGASVAFGEEMEYAQDLPLPLFVVMPQGGPFKPGQGYIKGFGQTVPVIWMVDEKIDVAVWGAAGDSAQPIDNAVAARQAMNTMLQALNHQRPSGLTFRPIERRWRTMQGALARFGRGLVLTFAVDDPIPDVVPQTATVTSVEIDDTITT